MTMRDDVRGSGRNEMDAAVDVAPGVPTDRVRWGPILAGTFAALTALAILGTLGVAVGLSAYDPGRDNPRNFALGYGIWGIISTILAFMFGGWLCARVAALHGRDNGLLNGMMVAAFGLPLLMFLLGSAGSMMGQSDAATNRGAQARSNSGDSAVMASGRMSPDNAGGTSATANNPDRDQARRAASRTAWATLISLALALGAASVGGYVGSRADDDDDRSSRRRRISALDRPTTGV